MKISLMAQDKLYLSHLKILGYYTYYLQHALDIFLLMLFDLTVGGFVWGTLSCGLLTVVVLAS